MSSIAVIRPVGDQRNMTLSELGVRQVIDSGTTITGTIEAASGLMIKGTVKGDVIMNSKDGKEGLVFIHPLGAVYGKIRSDVILLAGKCSGAIHCNRVRMYKTAEFEGEMSYVDIQVDHGAKLKMAMMGMNGNQPQQESAHEATKP